MTKYFENLNKSIILGLVMSIVSIIMLVYQANKDIIYSIPSNLFIIGTMIYFISALIKIKSGKDFMKFSSIILIITIGISVLKKIRNISIDSMLLKYGVGNVLNEFIDVVVVIYLFVFLIFLITLFFRKIIIVENFIKRAFVYTSILVVFCCILACICSFNYISPFGGYIYYIRMLIFSISIIPYFYQYHNRIINHYQESENKKKNVLEIVGFIVIIFVIIVFIWREAIYLPKNNIENKIELLSTNYENLNVDYTTESIKGLSFKLAKSLKVEEEFSSNEIKYIKKGSGSGYIIIALDNKTQNKLKGGIWIINDKKYGYLDMEFKEFTYNNIIYEYAYMGDTLLIYGFMKNNKSVFISMDEECYAMLSLEELAGLLNIEWF